MDLTISDIPIQHIQTALVLTTMPIIYRDR
jgi:hypothetical protein